MKWFGTNRTLYCCFLQLFETFNMNAMITLEPKRRFTRWPEIFEADRAVSHAARPTTVFLVVNTNAHVTYIAVDKIICSADTTNSTIAAMINLFAWSIVIIQMADIAVVRGKRDVTRHARIRNWLTTTANGTNDRSDCMPINCMSIFWIEPPVLNIFFVVAEATWKHFVAARRNESTFALIMRTGCWGRGVGNGWCQRF